MKKTYYRGTGTDVENLKSESRKFDCDYGQGFYLCESQKDAIESAMKRKDPFVIEYEANLDSLNIFEFGDNEQWLDYILSADKQEIHGYDAVVGNYVNSDLKAIIDNLENNELSRKEALKLINDANPSKQIVIKTSKGINTLKKINVIWLNRK